VESDSQLIILHRALGSPPQKAPSPEEAKIVQAGYSLAAAEAFTASLAPALRSEGKPFRFEYLSGAFTERDPSKHLWFLQNARRIKVRDLGILSNT